MQKFFQQLLLTLFAFLQCLSPVAHAHVGGDNADHSWHSHAWRVSAQMRTSHVENIDSAVITAPHAIPTGDSPVVFQAADQLHDSPGRPYGDGGGICNSPAQSQRNPVTAHYAFAWSQAPPCRIFSA